MKIVINDCFGGFSLSQSAADTLGCNRYPGDWVRTDERLIALVEKNNIAASGSCAKLVVVEIPDTATDWTITEYDGAESVIAVIDGKLHFFH